MIDPGRSAASFRDPAGFVFRRDGTVYRQVNDRGRDDYDRLIGSGLYDELAGAGLMVRHEEVGERGGAGSYRVIRPEPIPFITYPYEWCFGQLRDAALLTLDLQRRAIGAGMSLKDASGYNVQFRGGRAVFIDTLSFESAREGRPWVAYRQFCEHFLAPLAIMSRVDARLGRSLLRSHVDGVPLDLAARLLPWGTRVRPGLLLHVHVHASLQARHADGGRPARAATPGPGRGARFGRSAMLGLIDGLRSAVLGLRAPGLSSGWSGYATDNTYSEAARVQKRRFVASAIDDVGPSTAWDLGANTGDYSRIASSRGIATLAIDLDPACVERNHAEAARAGDASLVPIVMDLADPSPSIGWRNRERPGLLDRGPADLVLALALVHHLAIARNVPLPEVAAFVREAGAAAVVEFVPKDDPQVARLLAGRDDIFDDYGREAFEAAFLGRFAIDRAEPLADSGRVLYLLRARD